MPTFIERHADNIRGVLSCFDRVVLTGTLPDLCHAGAMAQYLGARDIRLFDYPRWAEPFREEVRAHAEPLAREAGLPIEFIRRVKELRKEKRIQQLLAARGEHPGLARNRCQVCQVPDGCDPQTQLAGPGEVPHPRSGWPGCIGRSLGRRSASRTPWPP